jgi:cellulose synthase/poly-beta-1,6-N-acetylglucosamine synthase-like glycosyltransferase
MTKRNTTIIAFILLAIASRLLILAGQGWANFSPLASMALFVGAYLHSRKQAVAWTLLAVWGSNLILNNTLYDAYFPGFSLGIDAVHMGLFALISLLGQNTTASASRFIGTNLAAAMGFFLISNFAVWAGSEITYTKDLSGLLTCFAAGIPFLKNTLASQFLFSGLFFGGFELLKKQVPALR